MLQFTVGSPLYMAMDPGQAILYWTDAENHQIKFLRYHTDIVGFLFPCRSLYDVAYEPPSVTANITTTLVTYIGTTPVGLAFDDGRGIPPVKDHYIDCYGNGLCMGYAGAFKCKCFDGFSGDCQDRACPKGAAW